MVRTYKRKTERSNIDEDAVASAISEVLEGNLSIRKAADKYNLKAATLQHRIEGKKKKIDNEGKASYFSKYSSQQIFTVEQEELLKEYVIKSSKMHHGLTLTQVRQLAYQYAKMLGCRYPSSWDDNKSAGIDWISGFRKRNTTISLRKPENTSFARSFSFNKTAVATFFNNLEDVMSRYKFTPDRVINFDETGITTVLNTPKVLAEKTQRQVGQIVSAERGELVTFGGIITATGNTIPPVFVFPRVHYKNHFLNGAPEGSLGLSSRSGWINGELFLEVLSHIQKHTNSTKERPILLVCDNHESHISIEAINYSRDNGIIYLSFPPHTSHKLQPLDVGVFGPFKAKLKVAFNDWHVNHPGKTLTIYDIPNLARLAFLESFTGKNITSAFSKPGIVPFNKLAFSDEDFAPCGIYSIPESQDTVQNPPSSAKTPNETAADEQVDKPSPQNEPSTSNASLSISQILDPIPSTSKTCITPEVVRPYPKISQGNKTKKGREKGKSRIYTDSPEKQRIEELHRIKYEKDLQKGQRKHATDLKTAQNLLGILQNPVKKQTKKKTSKSIVMDSESSSSYSEIEQDSLGSDQSYAELPDEDIIDTIVPKSGYVKKDDFVLIKLVKSGKKQTVQYFVGKILFRYGEEHGNGFQVSFLKRKPSGTFVFPDKIDEAYVRISDIVLKLPDPTVAKCTNRTASLFNFKINLSAYNIPL